MVLKTGVDRSDDTVCREVVERVRNELGPVAAFKSVVVTRLLPKTRSGKILRAAIRRVADDEAVALPATIDDPSAMDAVREALNSIGYGASKR